MKHFIILLIMACHGIGLSQDMKDINHPVSIDTIRKLVYHRNVVFVSMDKSIKAHYELDESGKYSFFRGFSFSPSLNSFFLFHNDISKKEVRNSYVIEEVLIYPQIDTIKSFFPLNDILISSQDTILTGRWLLHNDALLASFKLSHLMAFLITKCGFVYEEGSVLSVAKSMYSYDSENLREKDEYWICVGNLNDEAQNVFFYEIASDDLSGYNLKMSDSVSVSQNKFKRLRRLITKLNEMPDFDFCELDNVDEKLIAVGNKKYFFSYECLRERKEKRYMKVHHKISQEIFGICLKNIEYRGKY
jgi:hypothetical protein